MQKKFISLKEKMTVLLLLQFLCLIILVTGTLHITMLGSIKTLEEKYISENIEAANNALNHQMEMLDTLTFDWGVWDDTYSFIQDANQNYLDSALTPDTVTNMDVGIFSFIDPDGKEILNVINHDESVEYSKNTLFEREQTTMLIEVMTEKKEGSALSGFMKIQSKPYIFSMLQVTKSNGSGTNVGYIFLAREFNDELIESLNQQYRTDLSIRHNSDQVDVVVETFDEIEKTILLEDVFDSPLMTLQIRISRELYRTASDGLNRTLVIIVVILMLFGVLIYQFWNKGVMSRLIRLKNDVSGLKEDTLSDVLMNNMSQNKDEIDLLRYEIFLMHSQIHAHARTIKVKQIELEVINQTLENQVQERTGELVELNNRLYESELNYRTIVNEFPELVFRINIEDIFLACEGGLQNQLFMPKEAFLNKNAKEVLPVELYEQFSENKSKALSSHEMQEYEYPLAINNAIRYYRAKLIPQHNNELYMFISDITPTIETIKQIEQLSHCDQLTGLYNRRFLEIEYTRLNNTRNFPFTVLALDVNGLKLINDAFGHYSGDYLLKEVANAIKDNLRSDDIVARMGGDEFVVLLPNTNEGIAQQLVDRIRNDVHLIDVYGIHGSISIGSFTSTEKIMELDDMLKSADEKMYRIKNHEGQDFRFNAVLSMQEKLIKISDCEKIHSEHVYETSLKIGEKLNLSDLDLFNLGIAAKYHDIGKLAIPEEILLKESSLTSDEYEKMKRHSEIGYLIIKSSDQLRHVAESVLYHHEKWDGTGYTSGLKGESIPLYSRIIHVADAFEAMIHYRPYKALKTVEEAITELNEHSGKQFDPEVVKALIEVLQNELR